MAVYKSSQLGAIDVPAPGRNAVISGGTYTTYSGGGNTYDVQTFLASGTLVVSKSGYVDALIVGGGGSGGCGNRTFGSGGGGAGTTYGGNGGRIMLGKWVLPSGTLGVVVGAGAPGGAPESGTLQIGGYSSLNAPQIVGGGGGAGWNYVQGARSFYTGNGNYRDAYPSSITGSSVDYGRGGQGGDSSPIANRGMGSLPGGAGSSGVVIVRWEI